MSEFKHLPVLLSECLEGLNIRPDGIYLDGTLGGGGHSGEILKRLASGHLYGIDRDMDAINAATRHMEDLGVSGRFTPVHGNFHDAKALLEAEGVSGLDGALVDLGVSSYQLDAGKRGFSYNGDNPLDMRMDASQGLSAADIVNGYSAEELTRVLRDWGEEIPAA